MIESTICKKEIMVNEKIYDFYNKNPQLNFEKINIIKNRNANKRFDFGRKKRLSCTVLNEKYTKTYRPQGIIFQTSKKPDYIFPFDLVLLSATNRIIVHYYRIKNNLHVYYNLSQIICKYP